MEGVRPAGAVALGGPCPALAGLANDGDDIACGMGIGGSLKLRFTWSIRGGRPVLARFST